MNKFEFNSAHRWIAPAKINLFLHVTGRRQDGYHTLETLFQLLDFGDSLQFEITSTPLIKRCDATSIQLPEDDLVTRAAKLLQNTASVDNGAVITLCKKIPIGGGLGGGSSDAATTLIALNSLWGIHYNREKLMKIALQLGADVPFFVYGQTAWATGIGEILSPFEAKERWYCVIIPNVFISTAELFAHPDLPRSHPLISHEDYLNGQTCNDFESLCCALYPEVNQALSWLKSFGPARMSGTGASLFIVCDSQEQAKHILSEKPDDTTGFIAKSIKYHPLIHITSG